MSQDVMEMFKEKNKLILINSLKYDIEKNVTSLLETVTNIFNNEFDTAIKNVILILEDSDCTTSNKLVISTVNRLKMDNYKEIETLLDKKKIDLETNLEKLEFCESSLQDYYSFVLSTTDELKESLKKYSIVQVPAHVLSKFEEFIKENIESSKQELTLQRIQDYLLNRLYGKLETKLHMEIMLRDNNLINKAKEGYRRYLEIVEKTEEKTSN
ncbi:MAG: hypothetical protein E7168_00400 [Firmicutes bacterium]|nr:hypothetical protein [Bacillota bacterium]